MEPTRSREESHSPSAKDDRPLPLSPQVISKLGDLYSLRHVLSSAEDCLTQPSVQDEVASMFKESREEVSSSEEGTSASDILQREMAEHRALLEACKLLSSSNHSSDSSAKEKVLTAMSLLPSDDTAAFYEAMRDAPRVVDAESDPLMFLRVEDFCIEAAARRLAAYWQERKELFGSRALLPMTLSGQGALTMEEVELLSAGIIAKVDDDVKGRPVMLNDVSVFSGNIPNLDTARSRCVFFFMNVLANESPSAQTEGLVILRIVRAIQYRAVHFQKQLRLVADVMPLKLHSLHVCFVTPMVLRSVIRMTVLPPTRSLLESLLKNTACYIHIEQPEDLCEKLRPYGLTKESVHTSLGGNWSYEKFRVWLSELGSAIVRVPVPQFPKDNAQAGDSSPKTALEHPEAPDSDQSTSSWDNELSVEKPQLPVSPNVACALGALDSLRRTMVSTSVEDLVVTPYILHGFHDMLGSSDASVSSEYTGVIPEGKGASLADQLDQALAMNRALEEVSKLLAL